jgi:vacuolar-type H+-ATPase subunit H
MVKKALIGLAIFLVVVIIALAAAPIIFKDQIKLAVDEQLEANINAEVVYDIENFSVSFFSHFPNLTAGITRIAVVGREPFAGETLFSANNFEIEINIWKLLTSELSVQGIYLDAPEIFIKVLEDGTANYDIAISSDEPIDEETTVEETDFNFAVEFWRLTDGHIIYNDATIPTYLELKQVNHSGSGNFGLLVFDLTTTTHAYLAHLNYDGDSYLEGRMIDYDLILNMDLDNMKFTFKKNRMSINDFAFGFAGWLAMPADDIDMDIAFSSQENSFKSLISLIPAMYAEDFDDLKTTGSLAFDGSVRGTYNENLMPAYNINLSVMDGMFQYPDLPEAINNVQLKMNIKSTDGNIDNTAIDISQLHLEFGKEPIDGYLKLGNLVSYPIDLDFNTSINLANLNRFLPMEGLNMEGMIEAHFKAKGAYDSVKSTIPLIDASIIFKDGTIRYTEVPAPIENINMRATLSNTSGKLAETNFEIPEFTFDLDGNPISGNLLVANFDNIHWRTSISGDINFDKLFPVLNNLYPMPGTSIKGNIKTQVASEGTMQDLENENYRALQTSGAAVFANFAYTDSVYMPQGFTISSGEFNFNPRQIQVVNLQTRTGASDFIFNGNISNYIEYLLNNELIRGQLTMNSQLVDINEFMTEADDPATTTDEEEPYSVIEVPKNIDFTFLANLEEIRYDNLVLKDARGKIIVQNGKLSLEDLFTRTLGGSITFNGTYNTADMSKPSYAMGLDVKDIEIAQTHSAFSVVKLLAPVAKDLTGRASSQFNMSGLLKESMMPDLATLTGKGGINILEASLKDSKFASGLTQFVKGGETQSLTLKDIKMRVSISDGKLNVQPFDLKLNNINTNIAGTTGLDGTIDYKLKLDVPAGQLGAQANSLISSITGSENSGETIKLNVGVGGTYNNPSFNLLGSDAKSAATQAAGSVIREKTSVDVPLSKEEISSEAVTKAKEEADKLLADAQKQADQVKLEAKKRADQLRQEAKNQSDKLIKDAGSNILKKTGAEVAGKKLIEEAEVQAKKIEDEGNKQADAIMTKARERAAALISQAEGT